MSRDTRACYQDMTVRQLGLLREAFVLDRKAAVVRFQHAQPRSVERRHAKATIRFCEERITLIDEVLREKEGRLISACVVGVVCVTI